jgi:hypothetical protein
MYGPDLRYAKPVEVIDHLVDRLSGHVSEDDVAGGFDRRTAHDREAAHSWVV